MRIACDAVSGPAVVSATVASHFRWVAADAVCNWTDRPAAVEQATARRRPLTYVVAFQRGCARDVTARQVS